MAVQPHLRRGVRALRRGDSGEAVRFVQERLAALGYDPGPPDGRFGFLTEDALMAFQRDLRLRVDGIAGPQVWAALQADLPKRRTVHIVQSGERLSQIADLHDVSVEALRWMNNLCGRKSPQTGDRLVVRSSFVLASLAPGASPHVLARTLFPHRRNISAIGMPALLAGADGSAAGAAGQEERGGYAALAEECGWKAYVSVAGGEEPLAVIACRRRASKRLAEAVAAAAKEGRAGGVILDLGAVPAGMGGRVAAWVAKLGEALAKSIGESPGRSIVAVVDIPAEGWRALVADPDYEAIAHRVRHAAVAAHRWERLIEKNGRPPGRQRLERIVAAVSKRIPPWKLLLGVPFDGWAITRDGAGEPVGYRAAVTEGYRYGVRGRKEEDGYLAIDFPAESGSRFARIVAPTRDVVGRYLALAHRFRLDGLFLSGVGGEDQRLWELCASRLKAVRGE